MTMNPARLPQWDIRLREYMAATQDQVREWGKTDCAIWSAGALDVMCGTQLADEFRGKYHDEESARTFLGARGWRNLKDAAVALVGPVSPQGAVSVNMGDVVYTPTSDGLGGLGILLGQVYLPNHKRGVRGVLLGAILRMGGSVIPLGDA